MSQKERCGIHHRHAPIVFTAHSIMSKALLMRTICQLEIFILLLFLLFLLFPSATSSHDVGRSSNKSSERTFRYHSMALDGIPYCSV